MHQSKYNFIKIKPNRLLFYQKCRWSLVQYLETDAMKAFLAIFNITFLKFQYKMSWFQIIFIFFWSYQIALTKTFIEIIRCQKGVEIYSIRLRPNVCTTPLWQWGFWQCLDFSWTTLRGKQWQHIIALLGVVDTVPNNSYHFWTVLLHKWLF